MSKFLRWIHFDRNENPEYLVVHEDVEEFQNAIANKNGEKMRYVRLDS
jgi:hypothetical protein